MITLAKILQHAGAVRAMEFDINPEWHTLITYTHHHGLVPTMVEPQPEAVRPPATSSPTTATSSPSTGPCPVRSPSPSSRDPAASGAATRHQHRDRGHQMAVS